MEQNLSPEAKAIASLCEREGGYKVAPDMLGSSQWTVLRNNRSTRVDMLHQRWIDDYHARKHNILPGDSLKCRFEESVTYDAVGDELDRKLSVVEVLEVITPPAQQPLI